MIRSGFFNSINQDRKYSASHFAEYFASFISSGVFPNPSTNLQVIANNDMTITVKAGKAWINGYILVNDDDYILELDPADGVLNRTDRIVARYDVIDREITLEVKKGTFASEPTAPILQRDADAYELGLADIAVNKGAISIAQANITDLRLNSELCGIVHGTVEQIDTTTLFLQYEDGFNTWFESIRDTLGEDIAGNLLNMINATDTNLTNLQQDFTVHQAEKASLLDLGHIKTDSIDQEGNLILPYVPKSNYNATTPPTINDDVSKGYSVGSEWFMAYTIPESEYYPNYFKRFICMNSEIGNAEWILDMESIFPKGIFYPDGYDGGIFEIYTGRSVAPYTFNNDMGYLDLKTDVDNSNSAIYVGTSNIINLSQFSKLYIEWEGTGNPIAYFQLFTAKTGGELIATVSLEPPFPKTISEIDVSSISSDVYMLVRIANSPTKKGGQLKVYRIWGE